MDFRKVAVLSIAGIIVIPIVLFMLVKHPILLVLLIFLVILALVKFLEKKAYG